MRLHKLLFILVFLTGCGHFDPWTREDKILQGVQLGVQSIDWLQTREIARNDEFYEVNPYLGENPTIKEVDKYFAISAITKVATTHILPQPWRKYWLMFNIGVSTGLVWHNYHIGIRIEL